METRVLQQKVSDTAVLHFQKKNRCSLQLEKCLEDRVCYSQEKKKEVYGGIIKEPQRNSLTTAHLLNKNILERRVSHYKKWDYTKST